VGLAAAEAFGRFGYSDTPPIAGFNVDNDGFVSKFGAAEKFLFTQPASKWQVLSATDIEENITLGTGLGPSTLSVNLFAPGFMLHFPKGFALKLHSTSAPYLSWKEASVGEHVPTPSVRWIGVSFKTAQPPIVLGFLDGDVSLQIDGQVGDWTLRTLKPYTGWVRVALPFGTRPLATTSAASLGQLSLSIANSNEIWWQHEPKLRELKIADEDTAVEATWLFDRKGVVVPSGAALANLGKYPLTLKCKTHRLDGYTEEGPTTICDDEALTIRFPVNRVPLGRALTVGSPVMEPIGTVSGFDVSGVVELALENLLAARDMRSKKTAEDAVNELIQEVPYVVEPHSNERLPFAADGKGIDVIAANALLYQAYAMSTHANSADNSLLTTVGWRRDWYSWRIWCDDPKLSRRAGALTALAGALCPEPERRLDAAMSQAGLAAERGLGVFLQRQAGKGDEPKYLEPLWTIRNTIFSMAQTPRHPSAFASNLLGMVRVFGDTPARCTADPASGLLLEWWEAPAVTLASGFPLTAGGDGITFQHMLGYTSILSSAAGQRHANLMLPPWAHPLPAFIPPPRYDEPEN
jgi:hypothetical protein